MKRPLKSGVRGHAQFVTSDGANVARLRLDRWWDESPLALDEHGRPDRDPRYRPLVVIGINPSDAGATEDDPTSALCTQFAKREGANGLVMVNPHPGITKDPSELPRMLLPYGCDDDNWAAIDAALCLNGVAFVAGWGKGVAGLASWRDRIDRVKRIAADVGRELVCFGINSDGSPRHPSRLAHSTPLVPYWSGR